MIAAALVLGLLLTVLVMAVGCTAAWIAGAMSTRRMHDRSTLLRRST